MASNSFTHAYVKYSLTSVYFLSGFLASEMARKFGKSVGITAVDPDPGRVEVASKDFADEKNLRFRRRLFLQVD